MGAYFSATDDARDWRMVYELVGSMVVETVRALENDKREGRWCITNATKARLGWRDDPEQARRTMEKFMPDSFFGGIVRVEWIEDPVQLPHEFLCYKWVVRSPLPAVRIESIENLQTHTATIAPPKDMHPSLSSMAESSAPHYVAFKVPGHPMLHMTLCYMFTVSDQAALDADIKDLETKVLPLEVTIGQPAMFGDRGDIPVVHVDVPAAALPALLAFYTKWYRPEPGKIERPQPTYHISTTGASGPLLPGTRLVLTTVYKKAIVRKTGPPPRSVAFD